MSNRDLITKLADLATSYDDADMSSDHATIQEAITALEAMEWRDIAGPRDIRTALYLLAKQLNKRNTT